MNRYAFIYNPAAKGGKSGIKLERLRKHLSEFNDAHLFKSRKIGDITEFIRQNKKDFDVFVACGGDGTVREVAAPLVNTDKQMGIIPMGTGNDLCKTLNIPIDLKKSVRLLKKGNVSQIDVGYCNEIIFLNSLGFGFDGLTNRYACELKHLHPLLTYALSAFKAVIKHSPFELTRKIDGRVITDSTIMFSLANGRVEGGSFWIAPQASVTDGKLNTILIKPVAKWLIPILLPLFLIKKPGLIPQVQTEKVEEIALKFSDRVSIHADGEVIEYTSREFFIYLSPNALKVISDC